MSKSAQTPPTTRPGTWPAVGFVMRGHWRAVSAIAVTSFLGGLAEALFLIIVTRAAFTVSTGGERVGVVSGRSLSLAATLAVAVALIAVRLAFAAYASWRSAELSTRVVAGLRHRLAGAFLHSSWTVQQQQPAGSLQELLTTYSGQAAGLMSSVTQIAVTGANLVALLGTAVAVDPLGALVLVGSVAVLGVLLRPLRSLVRRRAQATAAAGMDLATCVNEVSELGLELQVFHVEGRARAVVGDSIEAVRAAARNMQFATGLSSPAYSALAYVAIVGALALVAAFDTTSLVSLGGAMLVMLRSLSYGQAAQGAYLGLSGAVPALEELRRRLGTFEAARRPATGQTVGRIGTIAMEGVNFAYSDGRAVLRDISFVIAPREIIGIVGPSGAGKSTLVQLLLGLRTPETGHVLAGGRDLAALDPAEWARKVAFVPQSAHLVSGSIADNIRFFRPGVTEADVERAARLAHLHDDVLAFPERYERPVGKHGGYLSGGQQQRLCIARALLEEPDVLILDEPTSALDVRSEQLIRNTLLGLKARMTVIVVAHRLSTLSICDRIMVIKDGQLKGFDSPLALEQSSEFYREALALSGLR